jgi:hypothetical protein
MLPCSIGLGARRCRWISCSASTGA